MYTVDPSFIQKYAAAIMTPEAMQAATQPPPPPPPQGAPMDPAMGGAPMDPAMMPPPPQGAPMDPGMMPPPQGAPMDPAMGGMPPGGAPMDPAQLQQMLMDFMAQNGITLDPASGQAFDQNGQPVPPQVLDQLFMQFQQMMMGGMPPPQGAPMDPGMMPPPGGAPMDPGMMPPPQGAPMDPAMGGAPMDPAMMPPADPAQDMTMLKQQLTNAVQSMVQAELAAQDKKIAAMLDKVDTIKALLQQLIGQKDVRSTQAKAQQQDLNSMLQQDLNSAAAAGQQPVAPPAPIMNQMSPKQASINKTMSVLRTIRGN